MKRLSLRLTSLALAASLLTLTGCGSPLLDHANAGEGIREPVTEDVACPISLPKAELCASWSWDRKPTSAEAGSAVLRFWKRKSGTANGPYVSPNSDVFVKLWMPSMGHGSSPVKTTAKMDSGGLAIPGVYDAKNVFFVMPGAWEIWIQLKSGGTIESQAKIDIEI